MTKPRFKERGKRTMENQNKIYIKKIKEKENITKRKKESKQLKFKKKHKTTLNKK